VNKGGFRDVNKGGSRGINKGGFRDVNKGGSRGMNKGGFRNVNKGGSRGMNKGGFRGANKGLYGVKEFFLFSQKTPFASRLPIAHAANRGAGFASGQLAAAQQGEPNESPADQLREKGRRPAFTRLANKAKCRQPSA
jgi:hypothetical protein